MNVLTARRFAVLATFAAVIPACSSALETGEEEPLGEVASELPKCPDGICPTPDPPDPKCTPACSGKACGADNGCGAPCTAGKCSTAGDSCGGAGVSAQCGHPGDLRRFQTGFRDQGARDTCTVFATVAALEAAYRRTYGLTLDLSEQYLHHVQKSFWLDASARLPAPEIQPENNGGGTIPWQLSVLQRYGLPIESSVPYVGAAEWQNLDVWTSPSGPLVRSNQKALDDFMLSASPVTYLTPAPITATVLPQIALEGARYRPTSTKQATAAERMNIDWYKAELLAGREIAFQVNLSGPDPSNDDVWDPGPTFLGGHAMLIVDFDDAKQAFRVKNSWGGTGFDLFSYRWFTQGRVISAATILAVADPYSSFTTFQNPALTLGRWNLDYDGWKGTLDIYRLPGDGSPQSPDRRIGTYFGPDGVARRVNGIISGNQLDFFIDFANLDLSTTALYQGAHFVTHLYDLERGTMAGLMTGTDSNLWSVTAQKGAWVSGVARPGVGLSRASYAGRWTLDTDGVKGTLAMSADAAGTLSGTYTTAAGVIAVSGQVMADPRIFSFTILSGPTQTSYTGALNGHALGVMTGDAVRSGVHLGFHATRTGDL